MIDLVFPLTLPPDSGLSSASSNSDSTTPNTNDFSGAFAASQPILIEQARTPKPLQDIPAPDETAVVSMLQKFDEVATEISGLKVVDLGPEPAVLSENTLQSSEQPVEIRRPEHRWTSGLETYREIELSNHVETKHTERKKLSWKVCKRTTPHRQPAQAPDSQQPEVKSQEKNHTNCALRQWWQEKKQERQAKQLIKTQESQQRRKLVQDKEIWEEEQRSLFALLNRFTVEEPTTEQKPRSLCMKTKQGMTKTLVGIKALADKGTSKMKALLPRSPFKKRSEKPGATLLADS